MRRIIALPPAGFTSLPVCYWTIPEKLNGTPVRWWLLHGFRCVFTTDASVSSRACRLIQTRPPISARLLWEAAYLITASSSVELLAHRGWYSPAQIYARSQAMPEILIEAGSLITFTQLNGNAADATTEAELTLEATGL